MVSRERVLLIVAADQRELAGVARRLSQPGPAELDARWARAGRLGAQAAVLVANGAGRRCAGRAVELTCERLPVGLVVSTGLCGSLDPGLGRGRIVVADRVLSLEPKAEFTARRPGGMIGEAVQGAVLTVDHVVQTAEEKRGLQSTGAVAVEMEAAGVAAAAADRELPFYCLRVVSDAAEESFEIDYNAARLPDGRFAAARVMAQAGLAPGRWKELLEWRRRLRLGAEVLGEFFGSLEF